MPGRLDPETALPPKTRGRILVIDDEADIREGLQALLESEGYQVDLAANAQEGVGRMLGSAHDLVLLDMMMPDRSGMDLLEEIRARDTETPVFLITAYGSIDVAIDALKRGATDYFSKPWNNEKLIREIDRVIGKRQLERENLQLKRALKQRSSFPNIVGKSERMLRVFDLVTQVAPSRATVLITGETGTGKELIANAIHAYSARADQPFVPFNTGSVPADLIESTLFGHIKGAFTSAVASRKGYFEVADRGTIFFDEIGTITPEVQAKLLRVIQEREFMPVGASEAVRVDVRIIAATNVDLRKWVEEGKFREDLYYRLNVIHLALPPLRDRKEDVPLLIEHFFHKYTQENAKFVGRLKFDAEAMQILMDHGWPGNVRELENVVERAVVLATADTVGADVLPEHLLHPSGMAIRRDEHGELAPDASLFEIVADFERRRILDQLEKSGGSQTEAAQALRIPLSTLNQKIKRLNIDVKRKAGA